VIPRRSIHDLLHDLRDRVTDGPGELPSAVRRAAASGSDVPAAAQAYTDKVRRHAYKVVDRDIGELKSAGWSEDEIFELTVATALGAGLSRLEHAARALQEARG
jgi:alkylhydroperoxidase family enzyme